MEWDQLGPVAVVDVETTGLDPKSDRIISVAIVQTEFDPTAEKVSGVTMTTVVNPCISIPRGASRINGFANRHVAGKPTFPDVAEELREFIGDRHLVGHNVSFDKQILNAEFKRAGVKTLHRNRSYCTMVGSCARLAKITGLWPPFGLNLDRALEIYRVPARKQKVHDALEDAKLTAALGARLCQLEALPKSRTASLRRHIKDHAFPRQPRQRKPSSNRGFWFWALILLVVVWLL